MISEAGQTAIEQFWSWFEEHKTEINSLVETSDPLWDLALTKLQRINEGLWFEVSKPDGGEREFIITAESCCELFPLVDTVVSQAPNVAGWHFIALKPPKGFAFKIEYEGIPLDPESMSFLPLDESDRQENLGLRVAVRAFSEQQRIPITNGVLVTLETGLGERAFASEIEHVEVCSMPARPEAEGYFPLRDLPDYLTWRKQKREVS